MKILGGTARYVSPKLELVLGVRLRMPDPVVPLNKVQQDLDKTLGGKPTKAPLGSNCWPFAKNDT